MDKTARSDLKSISIKNFKSLKSVELSDCRRINVLIGRPNVGKSNILEALALFDVPYMVGTSDKSLKSLVRTENIADLFHNGITADLAEVTAGGNVLKLSRTTGNGLNVTVNDCTYAFSSALNLTTKKEPNQYPDILTYFFPKQFKAESSGFNFLLPPSGANLMQTVTGLPELKENLGEIFHMYGLKMVFDSATQQIKAMKENGTDIFLVPFTSLADSLQRLIFYKSAIESNHGKIICFEEPEAHTFPPYISSVVNDVLASIDNQFFITTHSPYILSSLLEEAGDELAVFVVDIENNATVIHRLTQAQLQEAYDNGMDMFYNIEAYIGK